MPGLTWNEPRVRRGVLEHEYGLLDVPVVEVTYREFAKHLKRPCETDYEDADAFSGLYAHGVSAPEVGLSGDFILINRCKSNHWKLMTLWHEAGHRACVVSRCPCAREGFDLRPTELHAELACLYIAVRRRAKAAALFLAQETVNDLNSTKLHYLRNAHAILKHEVFAEAVDLVRDEFDTWLRSRGNDDLRREFDIAMSDESTRASRWRPTPLLERLASGLPVCRRVWKSPKHVRRGLVE